MKFILVLDIDEKKLSHHTDEKYIKSGIEKLLKGSGVTLDNIEAARPELSIPDNVRMQKGMELRFFYKEGMEKCLCEEV